MNLARGLMETCDPGARAQAGPGRGRREKVGGWVKTRELSLGEALDDPEFAEVAGDFKAKLISLVRAYLEKGILEIDELA